MQSLTYPRTHPHRLTHTHTHARARTHTHIHARKYTLVRARTHTTGTRRPMGLRPRPPLPSALYTSSFRAALPTPSCWWVKTTRVRCVVDIHVMHPPVFADADLVFFNCCAVAQVQVQQRDDAAIGRPIGLASTTESQTDHRRFEMSVYAAAVTELKFSAISAKFSEIRTISVRYPRRTSPVRPYGICAASVRGPACIL